LTIGMAIRMTRTAFVGTVLGLSLLQIGAAPAFAGDTWCEPDPPVLITTPAGNHRVVFVVDAGPAEFLAQLLSPTISYGTRSVQNGAATQVSLDVTISPAPGQTFPVHSEVWTGPNRTGTLLSSRDGTAGTAMHHLFILDVP